MVSSTRAGRALLTIALLLLAGGFAALPGASGTTSGTLLAGYAPGGEPPAAFAAAGDIVTVDSALGFAIIASDDVSSSMALLLKAGADFVETDGAMEAASARASATTRDSARWDSARWDSARWDAITPDSARWDSARWDSARWDSARWDSARWDSARWDSARWDSARWDSARWDGSAFELDPLFEYQWGLGHLNVPEAWMTSTGSMQRTLCVLDTGIDTAHPDLAPNLWTGPDGEHGWNFIGDSTNLSDELGHGTHVAGVAAAAVGNGIGTAGVANALILSGKVLNDQGIGGLGTLAQGIRWCADQGAHVISMSLSSQQDSKAVARAVAYAQERGLLLVASAGNTAACTGCPVYPAAYPGVVGVAALARDGAPAAFSNAAAHVDLIAPGELIAGPYPGSAYALGSGTSQATALIAGAALLAWDLDPTLDAARVEALLVQSARDMGAPGWDAQSGWGEPDVAALLQRVLQE